MKILIVSDTHGRDENLRRVIDTEAPLDMLIHLGDAEGSEHDIARWVNAGCDVVMVLGNNDFFSKLDREKSIKIGKYNVLLTHGHPYSVSLGVEQLRIEARARDFDMAMFGHTHRPYYEAENGLIILNPGSLSYPRQDGHRPSYMIMNIDESGEAQVDLKFL